MKRSMMSEWEKILFRFLQEQENASLLDTGEPIRHKSVEGGYDTVGYGHKLTLGENISGTIYGRAIEQLEPYDCDFILRQDMDACYSICAMTISKWLELDDRTKAMLAEVEFNVGRVSRTFPKFLKHCIEGNIEGQRQEYKRFYHDIDGVRHELARRNKAFYSTFLSDEVLDAG